MSYITEPPWARISDMALSIIQYLSVIAAGIIAWNQVDSGVFHTIGTALIVGGFIALLGAIKQWHYLEMLPLFIVAFAYFTASMVLYGRGSIVIGTLVLPMFVVATKRILNLVNVARTIRVLDIREDS